MKVLYPAVKGLIEAIDTDTIKPERKLVLQQLIEFIQLKTTNNSAINLNFICTHNSRRSHLAQIWAQTMAAYYSIPNITCYSGGTEATALFPMVAETLESQGFEIDALSSANNPVYGIKYGPDELPIIGFSKTYYHPFNPDAHFAAIMTCSQADEGCPFVPGAEKRIAITYEDPKAFDHSPLQAEKYLERSLQIATEMKFVFANIK